MLYGQTGTERSGGIIWTARSKEQPGIPDDDQINLLREQFDSLSLKVKELKKPMQSKSANKFLHSGIESSQKAKQNNLFSGQIYAVSSSSFLYFSTHS